MRIGIIRVQRERLAVAGDGFVQLALIQEGIPQVDERLD